MGEKVKVGGVTYAWNAPAWAHYCYCGVRILQRGGALSPRS